MTKEEISYQLMSRLSEICPEADTKPTVTRRNGKKKESEQSRQIKLDGSTSLKDIFKIANPEWMSLYKKATSGSGHEGNKILTLHSSALLALLCFSNVCREHPLNIDGIEYTKVWFEVRNRVFDNPSNVDIVLGNAAGDLLFIESKFTEYLTPANSAFSAKYFDFYKIILPELEHYPLRLVYPRTFDKGCGMGLTPAHDKKLYANLYMNGIKQCFSHLIGICHGPADKSEQCWANAKGELRFATILYKFKGNSFKAYHEFYRLTIGNIDSAKLKKALAGHDIPNADRIKIRENVLTYQDTFRNYPLPPAVRHFYNL